MVKVTIKEGDSIDDALRNFNRKVQEQYGARWYKGRVGYYESPSALKRKKMKMKDIISKGFSGNLWLKIGQKERYKRNGPNNSAGK